MGTNNIIPVACASAVFLMVAIGLMISHVHAWRLHQRDESDAEEREYRRRQYRRRMLTSAILGAMAVAMFAGTLLTLWLESQLFFVVFWGVVLLVLCFVAVLAALDIFATKRHFNQVRYNCLVERAKLEAELRRIQASRGNGKPDPLSPDSRDDSYNLN